MNFLAPNDNCPRCPQQDVLTDGSDMGGTAAYSCPACGHHWTKTWPIEPREPAAVREYWLNDGDRFSFGEPEPDLEGRYIYDDDPDW